MNQTKLPDYSNFIATSRYARWLEDEQRRETWDETVGRLRDFISPKTPDELQGTLDAAIEAVRGLEVMPSMRTLMTAGPALERSHIAGYNCAYLPINNLRCFDELMLILLCGTGVGFSVEKQYVEKLPTVNEHFEESETVIKVADSKEGWARALRELLALLYSGQIPRWDTSGVRPAGARLKTFGGRASGPAPLEALFDFTIRTVTGAAGRKLSTLECHDLVCKIAEVVVVGGVRRSALISLSDLEDYDMAKAKAGNWWENNPQRALANNSAVYDGRPNTQRFLREWTQIYESKSGERGLFNRRAVNEQALRNGRRDVEGHIYGTNPCSEIILRPFQFCNLSEVVVRADDDEETLARKIDLAVFLGTFQSTLTDFKYLRKVWKDNCNEERLLGVSLTGIFDNPALTSGEINLTRLKEYAVERNKYYANLFGIQQSVAVTCVKPSGTVSQLVDSASGLHPRHSAYYRRTVRGDNKDPMTQFLIDQGVEAEPDVMKPDDTTVFSFYIKAPEGATTRADISAKEHLDMWMKLQLEWCEHKPSVTVNVKEEEWPSLGGQIFDNFDIMTGIALLPYSEHTYKQAPYQEITEEEYEAAPKYDIDWDKLREYEKEDTTTGSQELACTGGYCEVVDISNGT